MPDGGPFPIDDVRGRFPALERAAPFVFFDNAAGAQIPATVLDALTDHLLMRNVQRGGPYRRSREVDAMIGRARDSVAAFVNARSSDEIAFGLNATSFIRSISLAIGQTLDERQEIVVSELDHEANVATWLALRRRPHRVVASERRRTVESRRSQSAADRSHAAGGVHDGLERHGRHRGCCRCRAAGPRGRRRSVPRRGALRPARVDRRAGNRLRLPGLLGIQGVRAAHGLRVVPAGSHQSSADVSRAFHSRHHT